MKQQLDNETLEVYLHARKLGLSIPEAFSNIKNKIKYNKNKLKQQKARVHFNISVNQCNFTKSYSIFKQGGLK